MANAPPEEVCRVVGLNRASIRRAPRETKGRPRRLARREIAAWIRWYNKARPQQPLGYLSPREHRAQQGQRVT
jgi:transposase InsO family protein